VDVLIHELLPSDLRHSWFDDPDGYMISDWELAIEWDRSGHPTHWRRLRPEEPADCQILSHLLRTAARRLRNPRPVSA
jgi:hypothetical protein